MKISTHLYSNLQRFTDEQPLVELEGSTVKDCLIQLVQKFPRINDIIFSRNGSLSPYLYVSVNLESAKSETLERTLSDGDQLYLIQIVAGG
jgi:sulfur-carrier protein